MQTRTSSPWLKGSVLRDTTRPRNKVARSPKRARAHTLRREIYALLGVATTSDLREIFPHYALSISSTRSLGQTSPQGYLDSAYFKGRVATRCPLIHALAEAAGPAAANPCHQLGIPGTSLCPYGLTWRVEDDAVSEESEKIKTRSRVARGERPELTR